MEGLGTEVNGFLGRRKEERLDEDREEKRERERAVLGDGVGVAVILLFGMG